MRNNLKTLILTAALLAGAAVGTLDAQAMPSPNLGASSPATVNVEKVWCCRYYGWRRHYWVWRRPYYGYGWGYRRRFGWRW